MGQITLVGSCKESVTGLGCFDRLSMCVEQVVCQLYEAGAVA